MHDTWLERRIRMRRQLTELLACPFDKHIPLEVEIALANDDDEIRVGKLSYQRCRARFPIVRGIPQFLVLEHVPSAELRRQFIGELARCLKKSGRLALSVCNWDTARRASGMPKEGFHPNGIYYYCYSEPELIKDLAPQFEIESMLGVEITLPKTFRLMRALRGWRVHVERMFRAQRF